jgi:uncharacterized damage-inducible protein DinB
MNPTDMLNASHEMVIQAVDGLPESEWEVPGACGEWSVKEIIAHLASYEHLLVEALTAFPTEVPAAYLRALKQPATFNATEVEARRYQTAQQIMDESHETQLQTTSLLAKIPAEMVEQKGTIPWYNKDACLSDLISSICTHTRNHCLQITQFRHKVREIEG